MMTTMEDIISTKDDHFVTLKYLDPASNSKIQPLAPLLFRLRIVKAWYFHLLDLYEWNDVDWEDTKTISTETYDEFRIKTYNPDAPTNPNQSSTPQPQRQTQQLQPGTTRTPRSLAAEFRKGIKRDKSAYLILKDERNWDNWKRRTIATMYAHGCQNVANPSYKANTVDDALLLREQNNFMYDVFATILQTTMGAHYVTKHEDDRDAQSTWADYTKYMKTSTNADMQIEELMSSLTSLRLSFNYRGTTQTFLIDWLNKMMQYEKLTPVAAHFTPTVKKAMLQNAVQEFKAFKQVKTQEQIEIARGTGPLPFPQYVSLLLNVSSAYDKKSLSSHNNSHKRLLNMHVQDHQIYYEYEDNDDQFEAPKEDEYFGSYAIQTAGFNPRRFRPSLPKDVWSSLSKEDQQVWDQVSNSGKWGIIKGLRQASLGYAAKPSTYNNPTPSTPKLAISMHDHFDKVEADSHNLSQEHGIMGLLEDATQPDTMEINKVSAGKSNESKLTPKSTKLLPSDLRRMLSEDTNKPLRPHRPASSKYKANAHIQYSVSRMNGQHIHKRGALVDRGANGGMAGDDLRVINTTDSRVDVCGIDNHELTGLKVVTAGGVVKSQHGDIIVIFHQYASVPGGKTIISCIQSEYFGITIDDQSTKLGLGKQVIMTPDNYVMPLDFINGLPYMPIRPFSDHEWKVLPHVVMTSDSDWDPTCLDVMQSDNDYMINNLPTNTSINTNKISTNHYANISSTRILVESNFHQLRMHLIMDETAQSFDVNMSKMQPSSRNYDSYRDYFLRASTDVIKKTFDSTTQYARAGWITGHITDTYRSPFPALNVRRRNEPVATDTIFSDTPAIDNGSTCAQIFIGVHSKFCDVFGIRSETAFLQTLQDVIRKRGAMNQLVSDGGEALISNKVKDVLRHLCIKEWRSEAHYQHQNPAERRYGTIKHNVNRVLNMTGAPASCWLLCLEYVTFIMNRMALQSLQWRTPHEKLYGITPDISIIYRFKFYDKIYFKRDISRGGKQFPSHSNELIGRFVGFAEDVGHDMTFKILTEDTEKIIYRSRIKLASVDHNNRIDHSQELTNNKVNNNIANDNGNPILLVRGAGDALNTDTGEDRPMAHVSVDDLIGRTYITHPDDNGVQKRLKIVQQIGNLDSGRENSPSMIKFRAANDDGTVEEVITYNQLLDKLENQDGDNDEWHFRAIVDHKGTIKPSDPDYKGSSWNIKVSWENGEVTWEPLSIVAKSDPVTCAIYAKDNNLLHLPGWTRFKRLAKRQKKLIRMANQAKLQSFRTRPVYKFGVLVPRNHQHAMEIDNTNGNNLWAVAEEKELSQQDDYQTFRDLGVGNYPGKGYKKIRVHFVYDVKPDLRRKARLVADGHLTEIPISSVYSSVVSLKGLKITIFIAELNQLETWCTDVGNAYLEAFTDEMVYIIADAAFRDRAGHTLVIIKALYGLKSSGKRWWERCSEILNDMGFQPSKAEDDIWMKDMGDHHEYLARYVDDIAIVSKNPKVIIDTLTTKYKLKLKGSGPIKYHLGSDFSRDEHGVLSMSPKKYIERMTDNYVRMFGSKPKVLYSSPLERGDHPELDTTDELDVDGIKKYQSLIGALQWVVTLGRLDIATAVMTMSSFRASPRVGHLDRVKRIFGYLLKMKHAATRFRTSMPDHSEHPIVEYDWEKSVYSNAKELIPDDSPKSYGPSVSLTTFVDANLCHDMVSGKSITGIIHFLNKTPIDYYTKKQPVVETATYGSEYMAARVATEQIIELRTFLRYLGVNLKGPTFMFGDNKSVVDSSNLPKARLHKRHVLLSFHRVREAISAKIIRFIYIPGSINPADILSKHWGYQMVWSQLQPILFWKGNTMDIKQ